MNESPKSSRRTLHAVVLKPLRIVALAYLFVVLLMLFFENALIYPAPKYPRGDWHTQHLQFEDVYFQSADGTKLNGWYVEHPQPRAQVIYFHGNGENVAYLVAMLGEMSKRYEVSVFAFDYRGYGRSEGKPNEAGVLADCDAAVGWLAERSGLPANQLVLHGRSLGGAAAVDMASRHGARGLILEDTFTSMPDVAARLYPWAPVRMLMRTQYRSIDKLPLYTGPLLQGHGTDDMLIPLAVAQRLHACSTCSDKRFIEMPGKGHNDPPTAEFYQALGEFYGSLSTGNELVGE